MVCLQPITIVVICLPFILSSCAAAQKKIVQKLTICQKNLSPLSRKSDTPPLTIWVHGTRFIRRPIFRNFFNNRPSLRRAQELAPDYYLHNVARILCKNEPEQFCMDTFYLFGWSGKLGTTDRQEASQALYNEIKRIISEYKEEYHQAPPFIRIISHSHGGTVALLMAKIRKNELPFNINELILLACPVQECSKACIQDDLFEHTIALYSTLDMVQIIAPQIVYNVFRTKKGNQKSRIAFPPFSQRRFQEHPKITQAKLKINGRGLFHTEFTSQRFARILPHIIHVIKQWQLYNSSSSKTSLLCIYDQTMDEQLAT